MTAYEYIRLQFDIDDLEALNRYSQDGWRVVAVISGRYALLERPIE